VSGREFRGWIDEQQWSELVRGEGCPLCETLSSGASDEEPLISQLQISQLRLASNQYVPGYCVLVCTRHVAEPWELSSDEQRWFFEDLSRAGSAIQRAMSPVKINISLLGNAVPHLHAHIVPRYLDDSSPGGPIDPWAKTMPLTQGEAESRAAAIKAALELDQGAID
jgi:diadenosine tetraphosphate (Ap4A) HIT family hydrolase